MKKYMHWIILGGLLVALVALRALASSSETTKMTPRAAEDWSRGQLIGYTPVKQPVALQPAPDGGVFLVWPNLDGRLELIRMGRVQAHQASLFGPISITALATPT